MKNEDKSYLSELSNGERAEAVNFIESTAIGSNADEKIEEAKKHFNNKK